MKMQSFVTAGVVAALTLAAPTSQAAYIIGSASSAGFFQNNTTALGGPTTLVSTLTAFDLASVMAVGSASGDLLPNGVVGTAMDFTFLTVPQSMFTFSGFAFEILMWGPINATAFVCANNQCSDGIGFTGTGSVTGNGFQPTAFTMGWSAQGSCNEDTVNRGQCSADMTASWSASLSATGAQAPTIPEPGSLLLAGLALAALGAMRRRPR